MSATALQRKIFSRYVRQKLLKKGVEVNDVVEDGKDGLLFLQLLEVLSDQPYEGKPLKKTKLRVQMIDNINNALNFIWSKGVEMKLKPSAENIVDGDERAILGMTWAIMSKFMKFGDDDEDGPALSAKDALLMWAQNKVASHNIELKNFKAFRDGKALCAIIHKHRPQLIDMENVGSDGQANLAMAQDAALKYFELEKYITPEEIQKLDENSMVVFVSEFYYGIAEQRKLDLACRRVSKVVKLTEENDALRAEYGEKAQSFVEHVQKVEGMLEDRTIDNTMAGARKRLDDFYAYKTGAKGEIIELQLDLEALFNNLAMRLSLNNRPEFTPPEGKRLSDIVAVVHHLEECEAERSVALVAELNRQLRLVELNKQHEARMEKLTAWHAAKKEYLETREDINSVAEAQLQLALLDAFDKERVAVAEGTFAEVQKLGAELAEEKYEFHDAVATREKDFTAGLEELSTLSGSKRPYLDDALAREMYKDKMRLANGEHIAMHEQLCAWTAAKEAYLETKEEIKSVADANMQLALLAAFVEEKKEQGDSNVAPLKQLGVEVTGAKYESEYSNWAWETPQEVADRESDVDAKWIKLDELCAAKLAVLDDDLARELFAEKVRSWAVKHAEAKGHIDAWVAEKTAYLERKEDVHSVADARTQLGLLDGYDQDKVGMVEGPVARLAKLGSDITTAKYETEKSSWVFETPNDITEREAQVDAAMGVLDEKAVEKRAVLDDDLARETFADGVRMLNQRHVASHDKIQQWADTKEAYLKTTEEIDSIADANRELNRLEAFGKEKVRVAETSVVALVKLGKEITTAKYETERSSWVFETPEEVAQREKAIDGRNSTLATLADAKKVTLDAALKTEQEKERLRLEYTHHASELVRWAKNTCENSTATQFGFTLAEVQAMAATLDEMEKADLETCDKRRAECDRVKAEMDGMAITENFYCALTAADLDAERKGIITAHTARRVRYDAELARQEANDALCKEFATAADPFSGWINTTKASITEARTSLEEQLAFVEERLAELDTEGKPVEVISAIDARMTEAGITNNRHTTLTLKDVEVQWKQYQTFVERKKKMLEDEIERQKLRGVTPEQFAEIEANFKQFDANDDGVLDRREVKTCLYSLGEEKTSREIKELIEEHGTDGKMPYEGYKNFMVGLLGVSDTKDDILESFKLITRYADHATDERMDIAGMNQHDIDYIKKTAPPKGDGVDFVPWVDEVFAR